MVTRVAETNLLAKVIEEVRGTVPFGTTETGINWAKKVLHPAGDGVIAGIPDGFPRPTAKYSIMTTAVVRAPLGGTGDAWDADVVLFHNPLIIGYVRTIYGAEDFSYNLFNPAVYPVAPTDILSSGAGLSEFATMVETYRPLYYSVTLTPIASTLTNQGTLLIAQYPQRPRMTTIDTTYMPDEHQIPRDARGKQVSTSKDVPPPQMSLFHRRNFHATTCAAAVAPKDLPPPLPNAMYTYVRSLCESYPSWYSDVNTLTLLPNTYVGPFREGGYSVMKLTSGFEHWMSTRDVRYYSGATDSAPFETYPALLERATAGTERSYPYVFKGVDTTVSNLAVLPRCEENVIHLSLRGMEKTAQFKLTIRIGWEFEVLPQSSIAPFIGGPSAPDMAALESYARIALRLKDGYPEAYNSWEKLVDVIEAASDAAGVVIPGAGLIGKAARWIYNAVSGPGKSKAKTKEKQAVKTKDEKDEASKARSRQMAASSSRPAIRATKQQMLKLLAQKRIAAASKKKK